MLTGDRNSARVTPGISRRDFMRVGGLGTLALSLTDPSPRAVPSAGKPGGRAVILLLMVGGPSQLETFDPKPDAPVGVRGPFGSIETAVPGVRVNEYLPKLARRLDRLALVRSLHHNASPIHETGYQLLQTGTLCRLGREHPHFGSVVARVNGWEGDTPPFVVIPGPIGNTGVDVSHGQTSGPLGPAFAPIHPSDVLDRDRRPPVETSKDRPASARAADPGVSPRVKRALDLSGEPDASATPTAGARSAGTACVPDDSWTRASGS